MRHKRVWKACERCRIKKTKVASSGGHHASSTMTLSPPSLVYDFFTYSAPSTDSHPNTPPSQHVPASFTTAMQAPSMVYDDQFVQSTGTFAGMDMLSYRQLESELGTVKPHVLSYAIPEVIPGVDNPMVYSTFDLEGMGLW
jgi:hypothetical protein